jgi:hypothetical protein
MYQKTTIPPSDGQSPARPESPGSGSAFKSSGSLRTEAGPWPKAQARPGLGPAQAPACSRSMLKSLCVLVRICIHSWLLGLVRASIKQAEITPSRTVFPAASHRVSSLSPGTSLDLISSLIDIHMVLFSGYSMNFDDELPVLLIWQPEDAFTWKPGPRTGARAFLNHKPGLEPSRAAVKAQLGPASLGLGSAGLGLEAGLCPSLNALKMGLVQSRREDKMCWW